MDITSYLLGKKAGGGTPINNQNKDVTITENGSTTVSADAGYTGLGTVGITTNVQPDLESKSVTITENTTTTITPTQGKDGLSSVSVTTNVSGGGDLSEYFGSSIPAGISYSSAGLNRIIKKIPDNLTINGTSCAMMFKYCELLITIPLLDTSNVDNMSSMFQNCSNLKSIPLLNTSMVSNANAMFQNCTALEDVPLLNTSAVQFMTSMFSSCPNLTDTSLNNILAMCANSKVSNKNLSVLGFNSTDYPESRIQSLSNYQDFIDAGWTIGY